MEIEGKIIAVLPERSGTSQNGPWKVAGYVIETQETYPKRMFFEVRDGRDGRIARLNIQLGKIMRVWWDINAREYEGKWYNTITAYDAREVANSAVEQQAEIILNRRKVNQHNHLFSSRARPLSHSLHPLMVTTCRFETRH